MIGEFLGTILGIITGLVPGLHSNNVASVVDSLLSPSALSALIIISSGIAHTVLNAIPAVFIGVPEASSALLPQHSLLYSGRGYYACKLAIIASLSAAIFAPLAIPCLYLLRLCLPILKSIAPIIVAVVYAFAVFHSKKWKINLCGALLAAGVGHLVFQSKVHDPLFILFSGLFGLASLVTADDSIIPVQIREFLFYKDKSLVVLLLLSMSLSTVMLVLPTLGSAQAALIMSLFSKRLGVDRFVFVVGALNTFNQVLSLFWVGISQKARTGMAHALVEQGVEVSLIYALAIVLFSAAMSAMIGIPVARWFSKAARIIPSSYVSRFVSLAIIIYTLLISGLQGLVALGLCTSAGALCFKLNARRSVLMGCITIPYLIGFF